MHKNKKKLKTAKLPKPIKVKKEKSDEERLPQPMTHYLDDRLEMIKQIFNTLKPKTIINLTPHFLKTQAFEEIEEACLNELLCISTKRLKSIIGATKCPTDTESSDSNDSDVERQEEHISLEEISSDSEIEGSTSKKERKKKLVKNGAETKTAKKDTPSADMEGDGHISVLELLELQARARAIRSQLALEPVTKIEVYSDEEKRTETDKSKSSKRIDKANIKERKCFSSEGECRASAKQSRLNGSTESLNSQTEKDSEKIKSKRVKLKRNYRGMTNTEVEERSQQNQGLETNEQDKEKIEKLKSKENSREKEKTKPKENLLANIKKEKRSRSPSPDVIPIVPEPETLLITDSEEENAAASKKETIAAAVVLAEYDTNEAAPKAAVLEEPKSSEKEPREVDSDEASLTVQKSNDEEHLTEISQNADNTQDSQCKLSKKKSNSEENNSKSKHLKIASGKEKAKSNDGASSVNHSDDEQNEDVISLGGDLENEMNEQLENEVSAMQSPYNKKSTEDSSQDNNKSQDESQPDDIISLESSDDERTKENQSWHSRYLKSSKVNKVLATSRLGKRVRDKIKKSKYSKKGVSHENSDVEKDKSTAIFTSKHEDGSIEQYKELLEMHQRKSS